MDYLARRGGVLWVTLALVVLSTLAISAGSTQTSTANQTPTVDLVDCIFSGTKRKCSDVIHGWSLQSRRAVPPAPVTDQDKLKAHEEAVYLEKWQQPRSHRVVGLTAKPWHDPAELGIAQLLEKNYPAIRAEMEELMSLQQSGRRFAIDGQMLSEFNLWKLYHFSFNGRTCTENLKCCPTTVNTLRQIDEVTNGLFNMNLGLTTFSIMEPSTHIQHHNGPNNLRIRCHLGLIAPKGAYLRVGSEIKEWEAGKTFCFDDSFDHEAWNNASTSRAILMFDVWHYDFTKEQVDALVRVFPATTTQGCREMSAPILSTESIRINFKLYLVLVAAFLGLAALVYVMRKSASDGTLSRKSNTRAAL